MTLTCERNETCAAGCLSRVLIMLHVKVQVEARLGNAYQDRLLVPTLLHGSIGSVEQIELLIANVQIVIRLAYLRRLPSRLNEQETEACVLAIWSALLEIPFMGTCPRPCHRKRG